MSVHRLALSVCSPLRPPRPNSPRPRTIHDAQEKPTSPRPPASPDRFAPRFADLAAIMRAPIAIGLGGADTGVFVVPCSGALTNRPSARIGPCEILCLLAEHVANR